MKDKSEASRPKVILMDVYGTLLDLFEVEKRVNSLMDSKKGYLIWFELFMQYCFVDNSTSEFNDFSAIAGATMEMTAKTLGRTVTDYEVDGILDLLKHLPLHAEVQQGLSLLRDQHFKIAALTNSPRDTVLHRMHRTGLISYFEKVLSAEQVKKYKPSKEVYQWAGKELGVQMNEILLVSVHGWDIAGAANAGMQTGYLQHDKGILYPLAPKPDYIFNSIADLSYQLSQLFAVSEDKFW